VIDEVGYLTYGPDAANVLFHVVNDRHLRKRPMIFTTNKPLTEWGKVLHGEDMAAAILDRVCVDVVDSVLKFLSTLFARANCTPLLPETRRPGRAAVCG
jgi:DNA replication protein DnaC